MMVRYQGKMRVDQKLKKKTKRANHVFDVVSFAIEPGQAHLPDRASLCWAVLSLVPRGALVNILR